MPSVLHRAHERFFIADDLIFSLVPFHVPHIHNFPILIAGVHVRPVSPQHRSHCLVRIPIESRSLFPPIRSLIKEFAHFSLCVEEINLSLPQLNPNSVDIDSELMILRLKLTASATLPIPWRGRRGRLGAWRTAGAALSITGIRRGPSLCHAVTSWPLPIEAHSSCAYCDNGNCGPCDSSRCWSASNDRRRLIRGTGRSSTGCK